MPPTCTGASLLVLNPTYPPTTLGIRSGPRQDWNRSPCSSGLSRRFSTSFERETPREHSGTRLHSDGKPKRAGKGPRRGLVGERAGRSEYLTVACFHTYPRFTRGKRGFRGRTYDSIPRERHCGGSTGGRGRSKVPREDGLGRIEVAPTARSIRTHAQSRITLSVPLPYPLPGCFGTRYRPSSGSSPGRASRVRRWSSLSGPS